MATRAMRILAIGGLIAFFFHLSHQAGLERGQEPPAGMLWAVGVLTVLFLVRAFVTEKTMGEEQVRQKDFLWGLTIGCGATIAWRLFGVA